MAFTTLFNVAVYSVVRHWISLTVEDESTIHGGIGMAVIIIMGVFYANYGLIGSWEP